MCKITVGPNPATKSRLLFGQNRSLQTSKPRQNWLLVFSLLRDVFFPTKWPYCVGKLFLIPPHWRRFFVQITISILKEQSFNVSIFLYCKDVRISFQTFYALSLIFVSWSQIISSQKYCFNSLILLLVRHWEIIICDHRKKVSLNA